MVKDTVKFSTKRHKKRKGFCRRKVVESEDKLINVNIIVNSDSLIRCKHCKEFYASVSNDNSFAINVRIVYSIRASGQGFMQV